MDTTLLSHVQPRRFFAELAALAKRRISARTWSGGYHTTTVYVLDARGGRPDWILQQTVKMRVKRSQQFLVLPFADKPLFDAKSARAALRDLQLDDPFLSAASVVLCDAADTSIWIDLALRTSDEQPFAIAFLPHRNGRVSRIQRSEIARAA